MKKYSVLGLMLCLGVVVFCAAPKFSSMGYIKVGSLACEQLAFLNGTPYWFYSASDDEAADNDECNMNVSKWDGNGWITQTVPNLKGNMSSVVGVSVVAYQGVLYCVFENVNQWDEAQVYVESFDGKSWNTLGPTLKIGTYNDKYLGNPQIAVDKGNITIAYVDNTTGHLRVKELTNSKWIEVGKFINGKTVDLGDGPEKYHTALNSLVSYNGELFVAYTIYEKTVSDGAVTVDLFSNEKWKNLELQTSEGCKGYLQLDGGKLYGVVIYQDQNGDDPDVESYVYDPISKSFQNDRDLTLPTESYGSFPSAIVANGVIYSPWYTQDENEVGRIGVSNSNDDNSTLLYHGKALYSIENIYKDNSNHLYLIYSDEMGEKYYIDKIN